VHRLALVVALATLAACPRPPVHPSGPGSGPLVDAPYDLDDEVDFDTVRDRFWAMAPGPDRDAVRARLTGVLAGRTSAHLDGHHLDRAHRDLLQLAQLYASDPGAIGKALAPHLAVLARFHKAVARAGKDRDTATALVLLDAADPGHEARYKAELVEVLAFVDDLAAAEHGEVARDAAPIATLAPIAHTLGVRWLVDQYVSMVVARQQKVVDLLDHQQDSYDLVAAHRDVVTAARDVAEVLARAGRASEIAAAVAPIHKLGADKDISAHARAIAAGGTPADWARLARTLRGAGAGGDPTAALAACRTGLARFPDDPTLLAAAAAAAASVGRVEQPIRLYEAARAHAPADPQLAHHLVPLYRERLAGLAESGRPLAARAELDRLERFFADATRRFGAGAWTHDHAATLVTAGRGRLGHGDVDGARGLLQRSLALDPAAGAYETLATIALELGHWVDAERWLAAGLELPHDKPEAAFEHAKLMRLAGEAATGAGDARTARNAWLQGLQEWADLGDQVDLPPNLAGERLVESGKILWALGEHGHGLDLLDAAIDTDERGSNTYLQVVSFLIGEGQLDAALDVYHRALGTDAVASDNKVYLSLWVIGEAMAQGKAPDRLATAYLRGRQGDLWPDELARLATGRTDLARVRARATTRGRRAELAYYTATLDLGAGGRPLDEGARHALMDRVLASNLVLFFEYDMARRYQRRSVAAASAARRPGRTP
jgi:tetratricopeptide (TPR) repeat protein